MAATLTGSGDLLYASFPIDKVETDADGDLIVFGRASDGSVDSDQQIVAPSFMARAAQAWKETGANLRVQHNAQRDPAGIGLEVETDSSGATWVKGLVIEPVAKRLVAKGALRAYSVGIARPTIERDPTGKARGGIITAGELVEISLVDRPANKACGIALVKAADDGTPEYVGKVFGSDDVIAKALGADVTKAADDDMVNVDLPKGASISISPADFAKLRTFKQELVTKTAAVADKRDVGAADRRRIADAGNAVVGSDGHISYPIENTEDLHNAAVLARSGHGDVAAARRLIARRAGELGVANPLDESDEANKSETADLTLSADQVNTLPAQIQERLLQQAERNRAVKEAEPEVTKDPEEAKDKPVKKAKKKPKKLPPWLNKPKDGGDDSDGDSDDDSSCKGAHAWIHVGGDSPVPDIRCEKCKTTPAEAAGLSGTHDMNAAPVPELLETPPVASMKSGPTPQSASDADEAASMDPAPSGEVEESMPPASAKGEPSALEAGMMKSSPEVAAILRFKHAGIDIELGRLHDLTCPAYHPEETRKCHPFSDLSMIDVDAFQREAVKAACGPDLDRAKSLNKAWQAAHVLRSADQGQVNDFRMEAHKAFRDANPGPASAPTPGMISPGKYNRPLITDGHEASSTGHDGPNSSPAVASSAPNAMHFDRPPLAAGHQSPSPSHMKGGAEYPAEQGRPTQLNYAVMEKEKARQALMQMHEHLSRQFPEACPIDLDRTPVQPESRGVPPTAGIGKSAGDEAAEGMRQVISTGRTYQGEKVTVLPPATKSAPPVAAVFKAPAGDEDQFMDADVYKGFKKMRKKLGKKVLAGKITVDEARAKMGRQFAQKGSGDEAETAQKSATLTVAGTSSYTGNTVTVYRDEKAAMAELVKSAVAEALHVESVPLEPMVGTISAGFGPEDLEAAVTKAVTPLLEKIQAQDTKLAETQRVIDAIADQPDPSTAAFSGLAFNPVRTKAARPAGVLSQAEIAERTQQMMIRHLQEKYNASSDPAEREAYYGTLAKMRGVSS